mmetsp:Transcript_43360/g.107883  ORF Transcript_43360/g.107883 Transcript_43360/m.107883 type:complete len:211 (-) Transcript_43360:275-907(-)
MWLTPRCLSHTSTSPVATCRPRYSNPKYSPAATNACSSGDEAHSSVLPFCPCSISTEWLVAMATISSRASSPCVPALTTSSNSDGTPSASSNSMNSSTPGLQFANAGRGALLSFTGVPLRSAWEMAVSPQPYEVPPTMQRRNCMWLAVRVPVLSEKMCETCPSSSAKAKERTLQRSFLLSSYIWMSSIMKKATATFTKAALTHSETGRIA